MRLIINADDFGLSRGINHGIYDAYTNGVLTSTTMMVTMPGLKHAVELSNKMPNLGIGIHLNITFGKPITNCKTLLKPSGEFYKPKEKPNQDLFDEEEIYQEFLAQYNLFVKVLKRKPTHIDSHLYAHQKYIKAKNAAIKLAEEKDIAIREFENKNYETVKFLDWFKYRSNPNFKNEMLEKLQQNIKEGCFELMVHPGYIDQFLFNNTSYLFGRFIELEVLMSEEFKKILKDNKVKLINFAHIRRK